MDNTMELTLKYVFKGSKEEIRYLKLLTHIAKNVYNSCLYTILKLYKENGRIPRFIEYLKKLEQTESIACLDKESFYQISSRIYYSMERYIRYHNTDGSVRREYKSLIEGTGKDFARYPGFLKKDGYYTINNKKCIFDGDKYKKSFTLPLGYMLKNDLLFKKDIKDPLLKSFVESSRLKQHLDIKFKIPRHCQEKEIFKIAIVPKYNGSSFEIQIGYRIKRKEPIKQNGIIIGVDLGMSNLITFASNLNEAYIIDGRELKSIIYYYNKKMAKCRSLLPKKEVEVIDKDGTLAKKTIQATSSRELLSLIKAKADRIDNYVNKAVSVFMDYVDKMKATTVVIGWNNGLKESGIKNSFVNGPKLKEINQMFSDMPLSRIKDRIKFRCELLGIKCFVINESKTSIKSFYDKDPFTRDYCSGFRGTRGLYTRANGSVVNADVNASLNMIRKYLGRDDVLLLDSKKGIATPTRIRLNTRGL